MSNIPVAREKLELVKEMLYQHAMNTKEDNTGIMLARAYVADALDLMHRKQHKPQRAPHNSTRINKEVRDAIKSYYEMKHTVSTADIARVFNVNQGRVSEVLAGKYDKLGK